MESKEARSKIEPERNQTWFSKETVALLKTVVCKGGWVVGVNCMKKEQNSKKWMEEDKGQKGKN